MHLVRWAADDPALGDLDAIDGRSIGTGVTLARWLAHEARRVYAVLEETDEERDRRELEELIQRKGRSATPRDLMRSSRRYRTTEDAEQALGDLVKAGIGRWEHVDHGGGRGRPTRRFVLFDAVDVDRNRLNPGENGNCVNVNTVNGTENAKRVNARLAEAAAEDCHDWGEV